MMERDWATFMVSEAGGQSGSVFGVMVTQADCISALPIREDWGDTSCKNRRGMGGTAQLWHREHWQHSHDRDVRHVLVLLE
jgi:hypothetical protein